MAKQYWVSVDGKNVGPLTAAQVREQAQPDSWVSLDGKWVAYRNHPDFQPIVASVPVPPAPVPATGDKQQVEAHLQFLGYELSWSDDGKLMSARHPRNSNLIVAFHVMGILHLSTWSTSKNARNKLAEIREALNKLTVGLSVQRVWIDEDMDLRTSGLFVGTYERSRYGLFLDLWNQDTQEFLADANLIRLVS